MSSKWRNDMKKMSKEDFGKKWELNTKLSGGTFIPRDKNRNKDRYDTPYHPSNESYDDFSSISYEGAVDDF